MGVASFRHFRRPVSQTLSSRPHMFLVSSCVIAWARWRIFKGDLIIHQYSRKLKTVTYISFLDVGAWILTRNIFNSVWGWGNSIRKHYVPYFDGHVGLSTWLYRGDGLHCRKHWSADLNLIVNRNNKLGPNWLCVSQLRSSCGIGSGMCTSGLCSTTIGNVAQFVFAAPLLGYQGDWVKIVEGSSVSNTTKDEQL